MSEALSSGDMSPSEALVRQILALQQAVIPELKRRGKDRVHTPTYAGLASHAMKDLIGGGEVRVTGSIWTEEELRKNATIWININPQSSYRIEVRDEVLTDAYDQDGKRVEDELILRKLKARLLRKRLAYRVLSLKNHILK